MDVWDGDDGQPIVTHGLTLTSKISVQQVLEAIAQYAFLASPFPVLLSVEIHCGLDQQEKFVDLLKTILGDRLVQQRLDDIDGEIDKLPSPLELKGNFLLKAKNKFVTSSNTEGLPIVVVPEEPSSSTESSTSSDSDFKKGIFGIWAHTTRELMISPALRYSFEGGKAECQWTQTFFR